MPRYKQKDSHLIDKRKELIWALSHQGYSGQDIATIFFNINRSTVARIINNKPVRWKPKWIKII